MLCSHADASGANKVGYYLVNTEYVHINLCLSLHLNFMGTAVLFTHLKCDHTWPLVGRCLCCM